MANPLGSKGHGYSVFLLAFTAVCREGIESVIFLAGVGAQTGIASIPLAALAGDSFRRAIAGPQGAGRCECKALIPLLRKEAVNPILLSVVMFQSWL